MSATSKTPNPAEISLTLGELLYADPAITLVSEKEWLGFIRAIAGGDKDALRALYERTFPIAFAYLLRLTGDRRLAESLILDTIEMVWCEAPVFDVASGPVLGWIMRHVRLRALSHIEGNESWRHVSDHRVLDVSNETAILGEQRHVTVSARVDRVLDTLTMAERQALEGTLLEGLSYSELAARSGHSVGTIKHAIRSGLVKIQEALRVPEEQP